MGARLSTLEMLTTGTHLLIGSGLGLRLGAGGEDGAAGRNELQRECAVHQRVPRHLIQAHDNYDEMIS